MMIKVNYFSLSPRRFIAGTKNSYGVEPLIFDFSSEWAGLGKTVTFFPAEGAPVEVVYPNAPINIPAEVMAHEGLARYTVCGRKDNKTLISITGYIDVLDANLPGGELPVEPTPDVMAQMITLTNEAVETAKSVRHDADLGLFNGEKGEKGARGDKGDPGEVSEESVALRYSSFLAFSSDAYFESDTANSLFFIKFSTLTVRGSIAQTIGWDKSFADVAEACGLSPVTSTLGVEGCLCIPSGYVISYCMADDKIKYGPWSDPAIKDAKNIVVIAQSNGRFVDGLPNVLFFMNEKAGTAEKTEEDSIPSYWNTALNNAIKKIGELQNDGGKDSFTFGFITDTHRKYYLNGVYASLMARVLDECDIPVFFHAGDLVDGAANVPKDEQLADIKHHKKIFKRVEGKMLQALGNHDSVFGVNDIYDGGLTDAEIYNYLFRDNETKNGIVAGDTGRYFYKDNKVQRVRYIVLDSHAFKTVVGEDGVTVSGSKLNKARFGAKQLAWLADALNVENGYSIVICSHVPPYRETDKNAIGWTGENTVLDCDVALGIVNAYRNGTPYAYGGTVDGEKYAISVDYSARRGEIVCWLAGHSHKDCIFDIDGLKVINTINCSLHQSTNPAGYAPAKTSGTDTEFAMDFICVNKKTKSGNAVRLGACLDGSEIRTFYYKELISFSISGEAFKAEKGMTWGDWVESEYNSNWAVDKNGHVVDGESGTASVREGTEYIHSSDEIKADFAYSAMSTPPVKAFTLEDTVGDAGDNVTYEFEEGMTWGEWKESEYNTVNFRTYENGYGVTIDLANDFESSYLGIADSDGIPVNDNEVITEGSGYYTLIYADNYEPPKVSVSIECGSGGGGTYEATLGKTLGEEFSIGENGYPLCPECGAEMSESASTVIEEGATYYCSTY